MTSNFRREAVASSKLSLTRNTLKNMVLKQYFAVPPIVHMDSSGLRLYCVWKGLPMVHIQGQGFRVRDLGLGIQVQGQLRNIVCGCALRLRLGLGLGLGFRVRAPKGQWVFALFHTLFPFWENFPQAKFILPSRFFVFFLQISQ